MMMLIWRAPTVVHANAPSPIAGDYVSVPAAFGPSWTSTGMTGAVDLPSGDSQGCNASDFTGFTAGDFALIDRGTCLFVVKVKNAQNAGASAVIVANNVAGPPGTMGGSDPTITIPSTMVSQADGATFKANLPFNATVKPSAPNRDSDLDDGVIAHEYTHGISMRLTGGPSNTSCLSNAEQPGEGWSDYVALVLTAKAGQTAATPRDHGGYVTFGRGGRPTPYSTDLSVDPVTYDAIKANGEVHFTGYMWASALWDMYWNLVDQYGFNPNIYGSPTSGGNNLAFQLVMDGLKLQPCGPGFVDSRDALLADQNRTTGANQCLIWRAFARRGLGVSASQGSAQSTSDGTENFDVPANACRPDITLSPSSLSAAAFIASTDVKTLTIGNRRAGSDPLDWTITEAQSDCSSPSDLTWVSESASGSTAALGNSPVMVTFDSTGLTPGQTYTGLLCLSSDDPETPTVRVPISLLVTSNCCEDQGSPNAGCDTASCESCVCGVDPHCCGGGSFYWDSICAAEAADPHVCAPSCACGTCGDNVINLGEQCDEGSASGGVSCCSSSCTIRPNGDVCRPLASDPAADFTCDIAETCSGSGACVGGSNSGVLCSSDFDCDFMGGGKCTAACPADTFQPTATPCRSSKAACDPREDCTGSSPLCPADASACFLPNSDFDGDGLPNVVDSCPNDFNPDQADADGDGVGDLCDNCSRDFNPFQNGAVCATSARAVSLTSTALTLKRVRVKAAPNGMIRLTGVLDTTVYGGLNGFVTALHTRLPADASTASTFLRQGNVLAVNVSGVGLTVPGQTMLFPACVSVINCAGTNGEYISFQRKRATNLFTVDLHAPGKTFTPPLSSAGVTVTFSLGGRDELDQASCTARGARQGVANCRK